MFTGIIEATAVVHALSDGRLVVARPSAFTDVRIGSSIAVSGACLTVVELSESMLGFDAIPETLSKTTLGALRSGDLVNLERALAASGRFEGHVLQGHVEATAAVTAVDVQPKQTLLTVEVPASLAPFIVEQGSIAIDGVSLTVARLEGDQCTVAIIPHTLRETTLGTLLRDGRVNVETDILGKYVSRLLIRP